MELDLYDKNGWVGIIARGDYIDDLEQPQLTYTKELLDTGEADQCLKDKMIEELKSEETLACVTLRALLQQAEAPVYVTDCAGDPREAIWKWDDPNPEPTPEDKMAWAGVERILDSKATKRESPKPTKDEMARARAYIKSMDWQFAKTMPQWPHWYVRRENGSAREFDFVNRLIKKSGYSDKWGKRRDSYLVIGKFKYWIIEDVLNRAAPVSNEEVRKRGLRWLARHGKKIGPWGRLINVKKRRRKQ